MANFYVIDNNVVVNFIVAENQEIGELVTGHTCIPQPLEGQLPDIGWNYIDGVFTDSNAE